MNKSEVESRYAARREGGRRISRRRRARSLVSMVCLRAKGSSSTRMFCNRAICCGSACPQALSRSKGVAGWSYTLRLRLPLISVRRCFDYRAEEVAEKAPVVGVGALSSLAARGPSNRP